MQKGLILKIAAGVFIGVLAALLVYSIPGWIRKYQEEKRAQEEKRQEERRVNEKLARDWWIEGMKPEQFPTRCGKLLKDKSYQDEVELNRDVTVEVTDADGKKIAVNAKYWSAMTSEKPYWILSTIGTWKVSDDDGRQMLTTLYPCLRKPSQ